MTKLVTFIGDVHGKAVEYYCDASHAISTGSDYTLQVGDLGVGLMSSLSEEIALDLHKDSRHSFIRGNHDSPDGVKLWSNYIPDGTVHASTGVFCVGGAYSIDREYRTPGLDWWIDEELSYNELSAIVDEYARLKPKVVMTHDCPEFVARQCFSWYKNFENSTITRHALQVMCDLHMPDLWVFGHWHHHVDLRIDKTRFVCLDELETLTVEV